uniref:TPR repeat n=1 Tax=Rheinheimera sp. BAL341 TaxID=1708203 RepID=A0A486XUA9_9GAMM
MLRKLILLVMCSVSLQLMAQSDLQQRVDALWLTDDYAAAKSLLTTHVDRKTKDAWLLAALGYSEMALGNDEDAEKLLSRAIKIEDNNADYQLWFGSASCNRAQQVNMLSAAGYAKRCLSAFKRAHHLKPTEPKYTRAYAQFLAQAPSIVGGDKDQALQLATQLQQIAPEQGAVLKLELLSSDSDSRAFEQFILDNPILANRPEPHFIRGSRATNENNYTDAIAHFNRAIQTLAADELANTNRQSARYQLARASVLGNTAAEQGLTAITEYLQGKTVPASAEWAKLRKAQLHLQLAQQDQADALLRQLTANSKDDRIQAEIKKIQQG